MSKLEQYVSRDGKYIIPVYWEMHGTVTIEGCNNLEEAYEVALDYQDDIPLPVADGVYTYDSFTLYVEDEDYLLDAQNFQRNKTYFKNPKIKEATQ